MANQKESERREATKKNGKGKKKEAIQKIQKTVYVIRKKVPLKAEADEASVTVGTAPFGKSMRVLHETDRWWQVECKKINGHADSTGFSGYVRKDLVSTNRVHDLGHLVYCNLTRKAYRTSMVYGGPTEAGIIRPGDRVSVIAYCRPYALTSRGWCRTDLVTQAENMTDNCLVRLQVIDEEGALKVYMAVAEKARDDYIRSERSRIGIRQWAHSKEYIAVFGETGDDFIKSCALQARAYAKENGLAEVRYLPKEEIMAKARGSVLMGKTVDEEISCGRRKRT